MSSADAAERSRAYRTVADSRVFCQMKTASMECTRLETGLVCSRRIRDTIVLVRLLYIKPAIVGSACALLAVVRLPDEGVCSSKVN